MQRWLESPHRYDPYVAGCHDPNKHSDLLADADEALRTLHSGGRTGKLQFRKHSVSFSAHLLLTTTQSSPYASIIVMIEIIRSRSNVCFANKGI